ncbi:GNAT family N-acetyltransferase, partial [Escherichia sp. HC-CC]
DKGYTVADPNLDELYQVYSQPGHAYWVVEYDGEVVGGGGIAPLTGSESDICELQKMYFLPAIRGKGLAKKLALMAQSHRRRPLHHRTQPPNMHDPADYTLDTTRPGSDRRRCSLY